jgi:hypothetical protein
MDAQGTHLLPKSGMHVLSDATAQLAMATHALHAMVPCVAVKVPGGHASQSVFPAVPANLPATQDTQALAPGLGPQLPAAQAWHAADEGAPVPVLNFPASQLVHAPDRPTTALYLPLAHAVHALRPAVRAKVPAAHRSQVERPVDGPNLPSSQNLQVAGSVAPRAVLYFPVWHLVHWSALTMPLVYCSYVPALHRLHAVMPSRSAYVPGPQLGQKVPRPTIVL